MSRPDEGLIHAWLDGECTPEESARIEQLVATDPTWAAAVAEARGLVAASSRIVRALDAVPGDVLPPAAREEMRDALRAGSGTPMPGRPRRSAVPRWAAAAAVVLVVGTSVVLRNPGTETREPTVEAKTDVAAELPAVAPAPPTASVGPARGATAVPSTGALAGETPAGSAPAAVAPRAARSAEGFALSAAALEGCWMLTAPDSLRGLVRSMRVVREAGDSVVVTFAREGLSLVTVARVGDNLRGGLTATRVECPPEP